MKIKELSNKLLKKLILLASIPMITLILLGPTLFNYVFGADWRAAGFFASILSIEMFFHFIFHPISVVFSIFEQQKRSFVLYLARLLLVLAVFTFANLFDLRPSTTVWIYSIFMSLIEYSKYLLAQKIMIEESKDKL